MDNSIKFSIIIPAYNAENTIEKCINNIQSQTYRDFEVIVINDGSKDSTAEILENLTLAYTNMQYKTVENNGPGVARNQGIELAKGEYLIFIDVDDFIKEDFLLNHYSLIENKEYDLIVTGYHTIVYNGSEAVSKRTTTYPSIDLNSLEDFKDELYPLMNQQMMYVVWNKVYKSNIVKENQIEFPNYRSCEDRIFNLRYFKHINNAKIDERINFEYSFDGKNSLTNRYFDNKFDTFIHWYDILIDFVDNDYEGYASLFLKGVMSCLMSLHSESCHLSNKEKREYIDTILKNKVVSKAAKISSNETMMKKAISSILNVKNITLNFYASKFIHLVSQTSPTLIEKVKALY